MSKLSIQDGALRAGISHHMRSLRRLQQKPDPNDSEVIVQPRDLFFDVDTIKIVSTAAKWVHAIRRKQQATNLTVSISGFPGKTITLELNDGDTVKDLKALIEDEEGISPQQQHLFLDDKELEDGKSLREYNIKKKLTLHLVLQLRGENGIAYRVHKDCFAEGFDYDFTKILSDQQLFSRGGVPYSRPLGSKRYALKVLDKYGDNAWLGDLERQDEHVSIDGEWPVAYHGTTDPRAAQIVSSGGFDLAKGTRFLFGHGIYCTPDPDTALAYAFPYEHKGETYKLIVQARVDPSRFEIVPKSKHGCPDLGDYWVVKDNDAIRPYGICVYRC